jgi:CheY-like chemotaxis protein
VSKKIIVETADRGKKAIKLIKERIYNNNCCKHFKIIFMDLDMPEMDGF